MVSLYHTCTGMTTLACISPRTTLLAAVGMPFLLLLAYAYMDKHTHASSPGHEKSRADISYSPLNSDEATPSDNLDLSWSEKVSLLKENAPLLLSFFIGYFAEFLSLNGVVTTLAFRNAPFDPRNHYIFYAIVFMLGECVGRSYLCVVSVCKPNANVGVIKQTWVFTVLLTVILVFLCFASWFRFVTSVWLVLFLMFLVGLLAGALYVNTYLVAGANMDSLRKEFSRSALPVSPAAGMAAAGFIGLVTEPSLRNHCVATTHLAEYCFTRSMQGWNATTSCILR